MTNTATSNIWRNIVAAAATAGVVAVIAASITVRVHDYRIEELAKKIDKMESNQVDMREMKVDIAQLKVRVENVIALQEKSSAETEKRQSKILSLLERGR